MRSSFRNWVRQTGWDTLLLPSGDRHKLLSVNTLSLKQSQLIKVKEDLWGISSSPIEPVVTFYLKQNLKCNILGILDLNILDNIKKIEFQDVYLDGKPIWSWDGKRIAVWGKANSGGFIFLVNRNDWTISKKLYIPYDGIISINWSPTGREIFISIRPYDTDIAYTKQISVFTGEIKHAFDSYVYATSQAGILLSEKDDPTLRNQATDISYRNLSIRNQQVEEYSFTSDAKYIIGLSEHIPMLLREGHAIVYEVSSKSSFDLCPSGGVSNSIGSAITKSKWLNKENLAR